MRLQCVECGAMGQQPFHDSAPYQAGQGRALCATHGPVRALANEPDSREPVKDFRPGETFARLISRRFVGCEFEMFNAHENYESVEAFRQDWRLLNCGMSGDGSIDSQTGVEAKTPPAQGDDAALWIQAVTEVAASYGMKVNKSCGLHVHVDIRDLDTKALRRLFKVAVAMEPICYAIQPPNRYTGSHARALGVSVAELTTIRTKRQLQGLWDSAENGGGSRYHGFNFKALPEHGTVEFRYHTGTLNSTKALNWVRLCTQMVDKAVETPDRLIPTTFPDFDTRLSTMAEFLAVPDLVPYLVARVKHFGLNVQELERAAATREAAGQQRVIVRQLVVVPPHGERRYHLGGGSRYWCALHQQEESGDTLCRPTLGQRREWLSVIILDRVVEQVVYPPSTLPRYLFVCGEHQAVEGLGSPCLVARAPRLAAKLPRACFPPSAQPQRPTPEGVHV